MADFSSQATNLGPANMAGSNPVAPVQQQLPPSEVPTALRTIGSLFVNGIGDLANQERINMKTRAVSGVAQQIAALNTAKDQGMSDAEYSVRSRAAYNQAIAANPQYASEIAGLNTAFQDTTSAGQVKKDNDEAIAVQQRGLVEAQNRGFIVPMSATPEQKAMILQASGDQQRMKEMLAAQDTKDAHDRAEGTYNQGIADRNLKQQSFQMLTQVAGNQYGSLQGELSGLMKDVDSGKISAQDAQAKWQARVGGINQTLGSIAGVNESLANAYKPGFNEWLALGVKNLDPKTRSENFTAEVNNLVAHRELVALNSDPIVLNLAATSKLFPRDPVLSLSTAAAVGPMLLKLGSTPTNGAQSAPGAPQVIGSENEADAFKGLRGALGDLNSGKIATKDMTKANNEATNTNNNILAQTNKLLDNGGQPASVYKNVADYFASPEYGKYVTQGRIDPAAAQAAKKSMQIGYFPAVTQAVGDKLDGTLTQATDTQPARKISDAITVSFNGTGVVFGINPALKLSPEEQQQAQGVIKGLQPAVAGLNTMNHIGAHLEGNTDYSKDWEANKWRYLPQIFPNPDKLAVGQVVNGKKYTGGNYRDQSNWMDVK